MIFYNLGVDVDTEYNINLNLSEVNLSKVFGFKIFFSQPETGLTTEISFMRRFWPVLSTWQCQFFYQISFYGGFYSLLQIFGTWISFYDALTNCFYSNLVFFFTLTEFLFIAFDFSWCLQIFVSCLFCYSWYLGHSFVFSLFQAVKEHQKVPFLISYFCLRQAFSVLLMPAGFTYWTKYGRNKLTLTALTLIYSLTLISDVPATVSPNKLQRWVWSSQFRTQTLR